MDDNTIWGLLLLLPTLFGILGVGIWTRYRWLRLKPVLFPELVAPQEPDSSVVDETEKKRERFNVPAILHGLQGVLEKDPTPQAQLLLKAAHTLEASIPTPKLSEAVQSLLTKSTETAAVQSGLIRAGASYAYIVVVPNRHEHPHLIRRYECFAGGWSQHAKLVKASLIASGPFDSLIGYLFFINPDAKEGVLLVSYANGRTLIVPSTLIQEEEIKLDELSPSSAALEFKIST